MAYVVTNPPVCFFQLHPAGRRMWFYESADSAATVRVSGYFTNGAIAAGGAQGLGMKNNDPIWVMITSTGMITQHIVNVSAAGVVDLSDATTLSTATNSD